MVLSVMLQPACDMAPEAAPPSRLNTSFNPPEVLQASGPLLSQQSKQY
jgi:hypothetical protein